MTIWLCAEYGMRSADAPGFDTEAEAIAAADVLARAGKLPTTKETPMSDLSDRLQTPTVMVRVTWTATAVIEAGDANVLPMTPEEFARSVVARADAPDARLQHYTLVGATAQVLSPAGSCPPTTSGQESG